MKKMYAVALDNRAIQWYVNNELEDVSSIQYYQAMYNLQPVFGAIILFY